ncbi:MAG: hypothetical protein WDM81_19615 [Rhizomicrobium sp.]
MFRLEVFRRDGLAERDPNRRADEIDTGIQRDLACAEEPAGKPRRELDDMGFALVDDDVALDGTVRDAECRGSARHDILDLLFEGQQADDSAGRRHSR